MVTFLTCFSFAGYYFGSYFGGLGVSTGGLGVSTGSLETLALVFKEEDSDSLKST